MKIKPEHLEIISTTISVLDTDERRDMYRKGQFLGAENVKDLNKRYRWDLCYDGIKVSWICDNLYPYMNDDHIDTALRSIVKPL